MQLQVVAFSIRTNLAYLVHEGLPVQALYKLVGLSREQLDEADRMVDVSVSEALLSYGAQQLGYDDLGFRIGMWGDSGRWGLLGHIVDCCQSIAQALELQRRYQPLMGNVSRPEFVMADTTCTLKWVPHYQCSYHLNEEVVTSWVAFAKKVIGLKLAPVAIHFTHDQHGDTAEYEDFFGCPVTFNSQYTGIVFKREILTLPLLGYSPDLLKVLTGYADLLVSKKHKSASNEVITQYIIESLATKVPSLEDTATYLGISSRSLQRKFKQQDTNFKSIVDDVRKEYAFSYLLQTNYKMSYIAQVLGFSEQSVFQRAFKRWTGVTPGEYRDRHGIPDDSKDL
ncbi:AraC family transcriptional regulator [Pseudomonas sp. HK3]